MATADSSPSVLRVALWAPPLLVAGCILLLGVNVYLQDEWDAIGALLLATARNGWSWSQLWAPHNEHRLPLPRLLFALLHGHGPHLITGMLLQLAVMGVTFAVLYRTLLRPVLRTAGPSPTLWAALFSVLFFSLGQKENLFWNFQLAWALVVLGLVLAALGLQRQRLTWFLAGLGLCFLCSAHWVALLPLVVADALYRCWQARRTPALVTTVVAAAVRLAVLLVLLKVYLAGGPRSSLSTFFVYLGQHPLKVAEFFLSFVGNVHFWHGADPTAPLALLGGALFLALVGVLLWRGFLHPSDPATYVIAVMLLVATLVCIGRAPLAVARATDSRYQACTLFGWLALLASLLRSLGHKAWVRWLVLGCLFNVLLGSLSALRVRVIYDQPRERRGRDCQTEFLQRGLPLSRPECAQLVYPDPARQELLTRELAARQLLPAQ